MKNLVMRCELEVTNPLLLMAIIQSFELKKFNLI